MARRPRQHLPGGFYHVTLRGNHRQQIFNRDADRDALEEIIAEAASQTEVGIHAYCWMSNHLHMVTRVAEVPLGRLMQRMAARYARHFQRTLNTTGHLFERRYHAGLVTIDGTVVLESPHPALLPFMSIAGLLLLTVTMHLARGIGYLHGQLAKTLLVATRAPD